MPGLGSYWGEGGETAYQPDPRMNKMFQEGLTSEQYQKLYDEYALQQGNQFFEAQKNQFHRMLSQLYNMRKTARDPIELQQLDESIQSVELMLRQYAV